MRFVLIFLSFFLYQNFSYSVEFKGKFEQGSFILGKTKPGSSVTIDKRKIRLSEDGFFAFGLGRDRKNNIIIKVIKDGRLEVFEKKVLIKKNLKVQKKVLINGLKDLIK